MSSSKVTLWDVPYKRKSDRARKRAPWYIGYTDHDGARRTIKGFTDRGETERLAAKLEHEAMLRSRGLIDPAQEQLVERRRSSASGSSRASGCPTTRSPRSRGSTPRSTSATGAGRSRPTRSRD